MDAFLNKVESLSQEELEKLGRFIPGPTKYIAGAADKVKKVFKGLKKKPPKVKYKTEEVYRKSGPGQRELVVTRQTPIDPKEIAKARAKKLKLIAAGTTGTAAAGTGYATYKGFEPGLKAQKIPEGRLLSRYTDKNWVS